MIKNTGYPEAVGLEYDHIWNSNWGLIGVVGGEEGSQGGTFQARWRGPCRLSAVCCNLEGQRGGRAAFGPSQRGPVSSQGSLAAALPVKARTRVPGLPHNMGHDG